MGLFNFFRKSTTADLDSTQLQEKGTSQHPKRQVGLLVTSELDKAMEECRSRVASISKRCRAMNQKFRDIEFDLDNDPNMCLYGVETENPEELYSPSDVQRVSQVFNNPQFLVGGTGVSGITRGPLGDRWFLSALSMISAASGLLERSCVARDEVVGVYGFVFFRDSYWVPVIIDEYSIKISFEELTSPEKHLYHNNKEDYNKFARKGNEALYFAASGVEGETWVPLIEKAYAKLHGDYGSLRGGDTSEAVEDLTGGVATLIHIKDILDTDKFWREELTNANIDRLFGCAFDRLDTAQTNHTEVNGLLGGRTYSVLRAVEIQGKRFVILCSPGGLSEWTGPWSDGSKEWTPEWVQLLPEIGHFFGNGGEFVMEYGDFLGTWEEIDRILLFDNTWVMSSQWLRVVSNPFPSVWTYGEVSFTFTIPKGTSTIVVLSKLDDRYFKDISGFFQWSFDFILFRAGDSEVLAESSRTRLWSRSVSVELELEAGDYVVHVRLDRKYHRNAIYTYYLDKPVNTRKLGRMLTQLAVGQAIASIHIPQIHRCEPKVCVILISTTAIPNDSLVSRAQQYHRPEVLSNLAGRDIKSIFAERWIEELEANKKAGKVRDVATIHIEASPSASSVTDPTEEPIVIAKLDRATQTEEKDGEEHQGVGGNEIQIEARNKEGDKMAEVDDKQLDREGDAGEINSNGEATRLVAVSELDDSSSGSTSKASSSTDGADERRVDLDPGSGYLIDDVNAVFLGLRVYTNQSAPATVTGQAKYQIREPHTLRTLP
ncbi:hypothetical protein ONZ45_g8452 [Pleurotus djamor]|nr:hypothetical protein ONZ45_g8452 [Pleurotus djamor]